MSMPWVQAFGDDVYTGFGSQADLHGDLQEENKVRSDNTIQSTLAEGLRDRPFMAASASNDSIGQMTRMNVEHARRQADAGMAIGTHFNAAVDDASGTLAVGPTA